MEFETLLVSFFSVVKSAFFAFSLSTCPMSCEFSAFCFALDFEFSAFRLLCDFFSISLICSALCGLRFLLEFLLISLIC